MKKYTSELEEEIGNMRKRLRNMEKENTKLRNENSSTPHWVPFPAHVVPDDFKEIHKITLDKAVKKLSGKLCDELAMAIARIEYDPQYVERRNYMFYASATEAKIASILIKIPEINYRFNVLHE